MLHRLRLAAKKNRQSLARLRIETLEDRTVPDATYHSLAGGDFTQNWSNTGLITANDDWGGVPSVIGFLGQDITTTTGTNPQTLTGTSTVANDVDVIANQSNTAITNGGIAEFDGIANPTVALQGSGTADAPYLLFHLDTTGVTNVIVTYALRDIDGTTDNSVQPFALQYRVGTTGDFINLPAGYVSDATTGPSQATLTTGATAELPSDVNNQPQVQVRVITANAVGNDEWVGVDDIVITATRSNQKPSVTTSSGKTSYTENDKATAVDGGNTVSDDGTNLTGATVEITTGYVSSQDTLAFANTANITGSFSNGKLTLSGTDTVAHYQDALRAITYSNNSDAPNTSDRIVTFIVTDGALSSDAKTKTITVNAVNDAPTLSGANDLSAINEDDTNSSGTKVADLISGKVGDPDGDPKGIALTATATSNGSWQYTTDGGSNWSNVGSVSDTSALLLKADSNTKLRFIPSANFNGTVSSAITFRAWDQTSGSAGSKVSTSSHGGSMAFSDATASPSISVNPVNDAPVLNGSNDFTAIDEDDTANSGTLVSDLISGKVSEVDSGAASGIAITAMDESNGTWEYTTDGGSNWNSVGSVSNTSALLLKADSNTRLRFVPASNFNGTVSSAITFRAWDQTSGTAEDKADTSTNGGTSAFSSDTASPSITVNAVNDAPTLSGTNDFTAIDEDDTNNSGTKVADLISGKTSDVDSGAVSGIALVATVTSDGSWQYTTDGTNWTDVGTVDSSHALLLTADDNTRLRLIPNGVFNGTVASAITFLAWDQTTGSPEDKADASVTGGTTAFSTATASASITVNAVNDAPTLTGANDFTAIDEDDTANAGTLVSDLIGGKVAEVDSGAASGIAVTATDTGNGSWQYTTDGSNWDYVGSVSNSSSLLLAADANTRLRFVPASNFNGTVSNALSFRAWDQTSGTAGDKVNASPGGGTTAFSSITASASITVNAINDAPTLSGANNFTAINENDVTNSGTLISALISGKVADVDSGALAGIAIAATNTSSGSWQYTTDGSNWNNVGAVSGSSALLLKADANTRLRFVPNSGFNGTVSNAVTFRAWDQTSGSVGNKVDTSTNGNATAFSIATASVSILVNAVNDAPTLSGANNFTAINEDDASNAGTLVSALTSGRVSDSDNGAVSGIALTATATSNGSWQYTTDGSNWNNVGSVSNTSALLLAADTNTRLRFLPTSNFNGTVSSAITFRAWDQTTGSAGNKVSTAPNGGATAFSTATASSSITVNPVNDAPILTTADNFTAIAEDDVTNSGTLVSDLISGQVTDVDSGAVTGVAITATVTTNGTWEYTTDGGGNWNDVGSVSDSIALLLAAGANTRVRFVPSANFNGTVANAVTFRAWDQTSGTAEDKVDTSVNGNTSAFSSATASANLTVNAVNDAPTLTNANDFTAINEDDIANTGTLVSDLINGQVSDVDAGTVSGIAVTATNTSNGSGQYTTDGGSTWNNVGAVSNTSALLLAADANTRLRFVPSSNFSGTFSNALTFRAWDQTTGSAGSKVDVSTNGGVTAFSSATASSSITVNAINDAPTLTGANNFSTIDEDDTTNTGTPVSALISGKVADPDSGALSGIAVTATNTSNGSWQYTTDGGTNWNSVGSVSDTSALLLAADTNTRLRFLPGTDFNGFVGSAITFRVWDQTSGTAGTKVDASTNGGVTAFSSATASASITVNAVNDAPSVTLTSNLVTVTQDSGLFTQSGFATFNPGGGSDEASQTPTYTLTNTNNALFTSSGQPAIDASGKLTFTPAPGTSGTAEVTVNVADSGPGTPPNDNAGTPVKFTITVNAVVIVPPVAVQPVSVAASAPAATGPRFIVLGSDVGTPSRVQILSATTGAVLADFSPFGAYSGGVRVAVGDITGDGTDDIVLATAGTVGMIEVIDGRTGAMLGPIMPFGSFPSGLEIALADIDGDGKTDLLVGMQTGGSSVIAFTSRSGIIGPVEIFPGFTKGVRMALGDVNGDGRADLAFGKGPGGDGQILVFDGATRNLIGSFASHPGFPSEVNLAVGDINDDGKAEILTAVAAMFGTEVDAFTPQGNLVRTINTPTTIGATTGFARSTAVTATNQSARIASADLNGDHITDILLGSTAGNGGSRFLVINGATGGILLNEGAFDPLFDFGLSIGVK